MRSSPFSLVLNFFHQQKPVANTSLNCSDFLSSIIHELKTPLNAIMAFSDLLQSDVKNPKMIEDCVNYSKEITQAAADMNELIHDLLDVAAISSGNFSVNLDHEINVAEVIQRSVKLNWDYALRRKVNVVTEVSDDLKPIKLDAKRLKQILVNILSNALKYSPEKTQIKIVAKESDKSLVISVSDQGFGMNGSQLKHLFEKYRTFENPNSGKVDSFGLGLAITKQLVELQKGQIEVRSEIGRGSEFILKFPYLVSGVTTTQTQRVASYSS